MRRNETTQVPRARSVFVYFSCFRRELGLASSTSIRGCFFYPFILLVGFAAACAEAGLQRKGHWDFLLDFLSLISAESNAVLGPEIDERWRGFDFGSDFVVAFFEGCFIFPAFDFLFFGSFALCHVPLTD